MSECPHGGSSPEGCTVCQPIASISAPNPAPSHDYIAVDLPVDTLVRLREWLVDQITMGADDETEVPFIRVVLDGLERAFVREHSFEAFTDYCDNCGEPRDNLSPTCAGMNL